MDMRVQLGIHVMYSSPQQLHALLQPPRTSNKGLTTKLSETACRTRILRPSLARARTSKRKGGLRPDSMASELSVTYTSGSAVDPLCTAALDSGQMEELRACKVYTCWHSV